MASRIASTGRAEARPVACIRATRSESIMRPGFSSLTMAGSVAAVILLSTAPVSAQATLKTPWGEPDLQGIWTVESDTPLQRLAKYAGQEIFTEEQRAELNRQRAALLARDSRAPGTEMDV